MKKSNKILICILLAVVFFGIIAFISLKFFINVSCSPTHSMEPTITPTDLIFGFKNKPHEIKINDIVVFYEKNYFEKEKIPQGWSVVHRIIRLEQLGNTTYFVTKGDNDSQEQNITFENILWKVNFICKNCHLTPC